MGKIISTMPNKIFSTFHSDSFYFMNDIFIISLTTNGNEWHSISYFCNGNTNGFLLSIKSNQILYILLHDLQETNSWIISHNSINWTSSQIQQNIISEIWAFWSFFAPGKWVVFVNFSVKFWKSFHH